MSFPSSPLPIKSEILIDGVWTDVTALGRVRLSDAVQIRRGYQNEQGNTNTPDTCNFTLNNRDGLFSNRNPYSTYYGQLGRNTQNRQSVTGTTSFLVTPEYSTNNTSGQVSTTDKAVLDIVGDIDIRIDLDPGDWVTGIGQILAAKYTNLTANRSWIFLIRPDGTLRFAWSADGNNPFNNGTYTTSSAPIPTVGRMGVRVTLDVDNGAAGNTTTFYTSTTVGTPTGNHNANIDFEAGIANWSGFGGAIVSTSFLPHSGGFCMKLTPDGVSATSRTECEKVSGATSGQSWQADAWVKCEVSRNVSANINWFDASGNYLSTTSGSLTAVTAFVWAPITATGAAPASAAKASLSIDMGGTPPASNVLYADDAIIRPTADATIGGGSWTQLGTTQTLAGTTSIFSGTAPVEIGSNQAANIVGVTGTAFDDIRPIMGKIYGFELYQNIAGTIRARMDATSRSPGDTSWSDGLATPNTWTVLAPAEITRDDRRFWGEISEFPQKWDSSGNDVYSQITASSITRRIDAGRAPLSSVLYRYYTHLSSTIGLWMMEDGFGANTASSALSGGKPAGISDITFGPEEDLPAAAGVARFTSSTSKISGTAQAASDAAYATYVIHARYPAIPSGFTTLASIGCTGSIKRWEIIVGVTTFFVNGYDSAGALVGSVGSTFGAGVTPDNWLSYRFQIHNSGGFIIVELSWYQQNFSLIYGFTSTTEFPGTTPGRFTNYQIPASASLVSLEVGPIWIGQQAIALSSGVLPLNGFAGESAGQRFLRLCDENNLDGFVIGPIVSTLPGVTLMGAQTVNNLKALLQECADADQGYIISARNAFAIGLRTRYSLYFQPALALSYSAFHFSGELTPTDDDQTLRNDVTVTRQGGGSARSEITVGPNNVSNPQDDPQGVGRYDTGYTLNVQIDRQASGAAGFATYLGTWDELRYPTVKIELARSVFVASASLTAGVARLDTGRALSISNLPAWLPPDSVELMVRGLSETLENRGWTFTFNMQPYGPFRSVNNLTGQASTRYRIAANISKTGTSSSSTNASITNSATSFVVKTVAGSKTWIQSALKPALFPLLIRIGGEVMSVGAIGVVSGTSPQLQTFSSVTRSVNGVVKAHTADEPVQIAEPFYVAY